MSRHKPIIHYLLAFLMLFQTALANGQMGCVHENGTSQDSAVTSSGVISDHQHHAGMDMSDTDTDQNSGCHCGCYCAGSCMHACQGVSLVSRFDTPVSLKPEPQPILSTGLSLPGFTTLPLRPPSIS